MRGSLTILGALSATVALALGVSACGGDDSFEGVANLNDAEGLTDALETLGVDDPAGKLGEQLDAETEAQYADITYTEDIEPLLGERGGLFIQSFDSSDATSSSSDCIADATATGVTGEGCAIPSGDLSSGEGAIVVETTDEDGARDLLDRLIEERGETVEDASHGDVDYKVNSEGDAIAIFDGFVVAGPESSVQAAIDASEGDSLADSDEFQSELDDLGSDPIFTAYASPTGVLDQLEASGELDATSRAAAEQAAGGLLDVPAVVTIGADSDEITLDASTGVSDSAAQLPTEESPLLRELPGDSWAASAVPDVGASIQRALDQISATAGAAAPDFEGELRDETGLELGSLTSAIGDVAFFVQGTDPLGVGGGAVSAARGPTATSDACWALQRLARVQGERLVPLKVEGEGFAIQPPGAPQTINVVQRDDRLVIAYGDEATEAAFEPSSTLGDSDTFTSADEALGDYDVSAYIDAAPALDLAEASGAAADPEFAQAQPYLDNLDYLITGASTDDDRSRVRAVLGLSGSE